MIFEGIDIFRRRLASDEVLLGSGIGVAVHYLTGFPISLPLWSFVLGLAFSASVGIIFGLIPAIKASRLQPVDALRHE